MAHEVKASVNLRPKSRRALTQEAKARKMTIADRPEPACVGRPGSRRARTAAARERPGVDLSLAVRHRRHPRLAPRARLRARAPCQAGRRPGAGGDPRRPPCPGTGGHRRGKRRRPRGDLRRGRSSHPRPRDPARAPHRRAARHEPRRRAGPPRWSRGRPRHPRAAPRLRAQRRRPHPPGARLGQRRPRGVLEVLRDLAKDMEKQSDPGGTSSIRRFARGP